jgi:methyl-accepting chemotaxis protein
VETHPISDNRLKVVIIGMLLSVCIFCEIVIHYRTTIDSWYTQFYYILIIIAGVWYQRKAIWIALFLAALHLTITYILLQSLTWSSLVNASMFICAAILVGLLSEEKEKFQKEILASKNEIERKNSALIGFMTEYTLRLKLPVRLMLDNLQAVYQEISESPGPASQETKDSLMIQIKNTEQILSNLETINRDVTDENSDIPEAYRKFLNQ